MAIKDILVHCGNDRRVAARLELALALAEAHDAHLTGVHVLTRPVLPGYVEMSIGDEVLERHYRELRQLAGRAREAFEQRAARSGVANGWLLLEGGAEEALTLAARHTDLLVLGQGEDDDPGSLLELPDSLILAAGRPVLVVPYAGEHGAAGKRIMVAWNGSREAARAVGDAMPLLVKAAAVTVFSTNPEGSDRVPGGDIATHMARHGVKVEATHTVAHDIDVGDVLLSALSDRSIDLLVMGGYGHSRTREVILGGVTRHILGAMTVPVLFSH